MGDSWQARLKEQASARRDGPQPWWVYADGLFRELFAEGQDSHVIDRTLYGMRVPIRTAPTDREGVTCYLLDGIESLVADESDMKAVMRCVRASGYHGRYRRAGEQTEYRF